MKIPHSGSHECNHDFIAIIARLCCSEMFDHIIMRKSMAICHRQMSDHNPNAYLIKWQQYEH